MENKSVPDIIVSICTRCLSVLETADRNLLQKGCLSMTLIVTSIVLVGATVLNVDSTELFYYNPPASDRQDLQYRMRGAGSIPRELGEKLLTSDEGKQLGADSLVVVVNEGFSIVRRHLRELVAQTHGIAEENDNLGGTIPPPKEHNPDYRGGGPSEEEAPFWPPLGDGLVAFSYPGRPVSPTREYQLTSKAYNRLESVEGYSEVRIRISDGTALLGKKATVLQLRRRDYSKERGRLGHTPFPLPFIKDQKRFLLVTDTEVALVEQLKQRIPGTVARYFVPDFHRRPEFWPPMLASMKEAARK